MARRRHSHSLRTNKQPSVDYTSTEAHALSVTFIIDHGIILLKHFQKEDSRKLQAYPVEMGGWKVSVLRPRAVVGGHGFTGRVTVGGEPLTVVRVTGKLQKQSVLELGSKHVIK